MTHTDPTAEQLFRAILADPDDDTVRLAYADLLDELPTTRTCRYCSGEGCSQHGHGDDFHLRCDGSGTVEDTGNRDRAELIRLQIRMADIRRGCSCPVCVTLRGGGQHHNGPCAISREYPRPDHREAYLLGLHPEWLRLECPGCDGCKFLSLTGCNICDGPGDLLRRRYETDEFPEPGDDSDKAKSRIVGWDRGWPLVSCTVAEIGLMNHDIVWRPEPTPVPVFTLTPWALALRERLPLSRVVVTDFDWENFPTWMDEDAFAKSESPSAAELALHRAAAKVIRTTDPGSRG